MTKQEAVNTLADLRKAVRELNPSSAMQAINLLLFNSGGVITASGTQMAIDMSRSLAALKSVFDAMDRAGL